MKNSRHHQNRCCKGADHESGIALIMALLSLFVVSTLAVGVMYSTQSEVWTTANYRAVTQARYIAEAGAQQTLNYLQSGQYDNSYIVNTYPMGYNFTDPIPKAAGAVVLATSNMPPRYKDTYINFDPATDSNFQKYFSDDKASKAPFAGISNAARFDVAAQLLTMAPGTDGKMLMRWKIVSEGTLNSVGTGKARVQIIEVVDNVTIVGGPPGTPPLGPTYAAGVFATGTNCDAIKMDGGQYTNGYDATKHVGEPSPAYSNTGGDIGSYGGVTLLHGAKIMGSVFTSFFGLGAAGTYGISGGPIWPGLNAPQLGPWSYGSPTPCSQLPGGTEWAVYEDNSGSTGVGCTASSCSQKTYPLPTPLPSYPTPVMPTVASNTKACTGYRGLCSGGNGSDGSGVTPACVISIPPSTLPNGTAGTGAANFGTVNFGSCAVITLAAGTYNFDSLYVTSGAVIKLPATGNVVINILDQGTANPPLSVDGGTVANSGYSPANLTIAYAGAKPLNLTAGANMFATIYAPNAAISVGGNAGLYGAVVAKKATFNGSGHVIYDTSLTGQHWNISGGTPPPGSFTGNLHVDEFSWSSF